MTASACFRKPRRRSASRSSIPSFPRWAKPLGRPGRLGTSSRRPRRSRLPLAPQSEAEPPDSLAGGDRTHVRLDDLFGVLENHAVAGVVEVNAVRVVLRFDPQI